MKQLGNLMGAEIVSDDPEEIGRKAAEAVRNFVKEVGIPSLKEQGFTKEQIMEALPVVEHDPLAYAFDGQVTEDVIKNLLEYAYNEE